MICALLVYFLLTGCLYALTPPPGHTLGQPWPMPKAFSQTEDIQVLSSDKFEFTVSGNDCDILRTALSRYFKIVFHNKGSTSLKFKPRSRVQQEKTNWKAIDLSELPSLDINIKTTCEVYPSLQMDESCESPFYTILNLKPNKRTNFMGRGGTGFSIFISENCFVFHLLIGAVTTIRLVADPGCIPQYFFII